MYNYKKTLIDVLLPCILIFLLLVSSLLIAPNVAFARRSKVVNQGKPFYRWAKGYASFNLKDGISLPKGGLVFYTKAGGPEVSFSFSGGYGPIGVGLGVASSTKKYGIAVPVPANKHFHKVYVEKKQKFQKYKVYVWRYDPRVQKERWVHSSNGVKKLGVTAVRSYSKRVCPNNAHKCKKK